MLFKTDIGQAFLNAATSAQEARGGRFIWAGALANGLTLLAFVGLVGNVDDPDAALRFLLWPLTIFMVGVVFGGYAGRAFAQQADIDLILATHTASMEAVQPAFTSTDLNVLHGAGRLIASRVPLEYGAAPNSVADAQRQLIWAVEELQSRGADLAKKKVMLSRLTRWCLNASMSALLVGTALIAWHVERGDRLQPLKPGAEASSKR